MFFKVFQSIFPIAFAVALVFAWRKVWRQRNTAANAWMLPFAHFSLVAWTLWVLQYVVLVVSQFGLLPADSSRTTGLWLAVMQNVLWITAILSLYSKQFARVSLILPVLGMIAIVVAPVVYLTPVLTLGPFAQIDAVTTAAIFFVLAISIWQLRVSKIYAAYFFLHGYLQWIWKYLWFPAYQDSIMLLALFPFWHIFLWLSWNKLINEMLGRFRVMISSTIKDLFEERRAADRAIRSLKLEGLRSEIIGSRPYTPKALCQLWAEQCNAFILIIGERYGHIRKGGKSVVQFEFEVARERDPGKILVYVKDGVTREPELGEFLDDLNDFDDGYLNSSFNTPDELEQKIRRDLQAWLASNPRDEDGKEGWY
jgi:Domain of unknown function (DUF4062)